MNRQARDGKAERQMSLRSRLESLKPTIKKLMRAGNTPGLSVAVICQNETIFEEGFGYADVSRKVHADISTIYPIASVSKSFAATACGILVAEGKLDWSESKSS